MVPAFGAVVDILSSMPGAAVAMMVVAVTRVVSLSLLAIEVATMVSVATVVVVAVSTATVFTVASIKTNEAKDLCTREAECVLRLRNHDD